MERTRKRASSAKSLRASNVPKKSKASGSSLTGFSASGGTCPDADYLCKTDHKTISNGENGRSGETKLDSSLGDKNCNNMEGSTVTGRETLKDQTTVFKKAGDNPEDIMVEPDVLTERNHPETGHQKTAKEDKPKISKSTEQPQTQQSKSCTCVCGRSYSKRSNLNRHQKTHGEDFMRINSPSVEKPIEAKSEKPCEAKAKSEKPCEAKVKSEKSFEAKAKSKKSFLCICRKSFTITSHLYRHQKTCPALRINLKSDAEESPVKSSKSDAEESPVKSPYTCACGKSYTCNSHLYRHQRVHLHGNKESAKTYICDCGKKFTSGSDLSQHRKTHTQEKVHIEEHESDSEEDTETETPGEMKPYICLCGKGFTSSSHLYRHQKTHPQMENVSASSSGRAAKNKMEKPFKCECGRRYTCQSHLNRHQKAHRRQALVIDDQDRNIHMGNRMEKPHRCECGKSFILWFSLMVHKRIHCKAKVQSSRARTLLDSGLDLQSSLEQDSS